MRPVNPDRGQSPLKPDGVVWMEMTPDEIVLLAEVLSATDVAARVAAFRPEKRADRALKRGEITPEMHHSILEGLYDLPDKVLPFMQDLNPLVSNYGHYGEGAVQHHTHYTPALQS